jgi:hypothetical protein
LPKSSQKSRNPAEIQQEIQQQKDQLQLDLFKNYHWQQQQRKNMLVCMREMVDTMYPTSSSGSSNVHSICLGDEWFGLPKYQKHREELENS